MEKWINIIQPVGICNKMGDHRNISRGNFFWVFEMLPLVKIQVNIPEKKDGFVWVTIQNFIKYYRKKNITYRKNRPPIKIDNIIHNEDYKALSKIFKSNTPNSIECQLRFYEELIDGTLNYIMHFVPDNLLTNDHSKRLGLNFMYRFYTNEIYPNNFRKYKEAATINPINILEDKSTKKDINRIVSNYDICLNSEGNYILEKRNKKFHEDKLKKEIDNIDEQLEEEANIDEKIKLKNKKKK
ncbi:MAG: hypothetical protein GWP19_11600, partial [Planctomycetia bacterium]|nr:hypothetical protein [Planctomycetia bacterium]